MYGMTSYVSQSYEDSQHTVNIELRTQNNRYRDINLYVPSVLRPLEQDIRNLVSKIIARGNIEINVQLVHSKESIELNIPPHVIKQLQDLQKQLSGNAADLRISDLLAVVPSLLPQSHVNPEQYKPELMRTLETMLNKCNTIRLAEGKHIAREIHTLLKTITAEVALIQLEVPIVEKNIHKRVQEFFENWMDEAPDQQRMYQEIASLIIKASISEELTLLQGHINTFNETLKISTKQPVGKKLDFLCQELNREVHTIASKSSNTVIHSAVVTVRSAIENMRELLRNIE